LDFDGAEQARKTRFKIIIWKPHSEQATASALVTIYSLGGPTREKERKLPPP
jgi:hypothetical protein